jgi:hypothetical protein
MTHLGVKFRETILPLQTAQFKDEIAVPGYEVGLVTHP